MNINLNNYEAYFLDYHEGGLSPALVKELMEFMAHHPELKEEFEGFEPVALTDIDTIEFDKKELLKKSSAGISASNFDEYAVQHMEGTLPVALQNELKIFIRQNPHYKKELELYTKTKLVPDTIVFEDKYLLKKGERRPVAFYYWSAAASVAIIIGAYFFLNRSVAPIQNGNTIVKRNQIIDSNTVVKNVVMPTDTNRVAPKIPSNIPAKQVMNVGSFAKNNHFIQHVNRHSVHEEPEIDSTVDIRTCFGPGTIHSLIIATKSIIQLHSSGIDYSNLQDTTLMYAWMKKYNPVNSNQVNYAAVDETKDYRRSKFLYLLAKYTCKGLHKITGQHIEFQKKYDSDTTNIIAYQLDLGNKKINFPVKE